MEELVGKGDVFEFASLGLTKEDVYGIYKSENKANAVAGKLIKERDAKLKETYMMGKKKLSMMETSIDEIKKQIETNSNHSDGIPLLRIKVCFELTSSDLLMTPNDLQMTLNDLSVSQSNDLTLCGYLKDTTLNLIRKYH